MKRYIISALSIIIGSTALLGQGMKVPLDKSFVEKTIEYYYSAEAKKHGLALFYIERDSLTQSAKTDYSSFKVQFLNADEAQTKLPQVRNTEAKLDRILVKWITLDTIDVVITGCTIGEKKAAKGTAKTEKFLTNCTENFVDVPTCRFVYDRRTMRWIQSNKGKYLK